MDVAPICPKSLDFLDFLEFLDTLSKTLVFLWDLRFCLGFLHFQLREVSPEPSLGGLRKARLARAYCCANCTGFITSLCRINSSLNRKTNKQKFGLDAVDPPGRTY